MYILHRCNIMISTKIARGFLKKSFQTEFPVFIQFILPWIVQHNFVILYTTEVKWIINFHNLNKVLMQISFMN